MCDDLTNHLPQEKICNHYCTCHLPPPNIVLHKSAIVCVVLMNRLPTRRRFVIIIAIMCDDMMNRLSQEKICNHYCTSPPKYFMVFCNHINIKLYVNKSAIMCDDLMNRLHPQEKIRNHYFTCYLPRNIVLHNSAIMFVVLMNRLLTRRRFVIIIAIMCDDDMIKILRNFHASVIQILVYVCTLA